MHRDFLDEMRGLFLVAFFEIGAREIGAGEGLYSRGVEPSSTME